MSNKQIASNNGPTTTATVTATVTATAFSNYIIEIFKFIKDLIVICYNAGYRDVEPGSIDLIIGFLSLYPSSTLIENFITYSFIPPKEKNSSAESICIWDRILLQDQEFMINNASVLLQDLPVKIPDEKMNAFKVLFTAKTKDNKNLIGDEDREDLWSELQKLVLIVFAYIHQNRGPTSKKLEDGSTKPIYTIDYRRNIDLKKYVASYQKRYPDFKLIWPQ